MTTAASTLERTVDKSDRNEGYSLCENCDDEASRKKPTFGEVLVVQEHDHKQAMEEVPIFGQFLPEQEVD